MLSLLTLADVDVVLLSRIQFALTIMFHYLFPPLTIGMGVVLVYLEGMYLRTGDRRYEQAVRFWVKVFGLNFAIGVATGIVMEFQFGTNWATYSRFVGDVFGAALAAEGVFAFFLESGFLAVLLFGWDKVSPRMHFFSTIMVALGSIFSSIWIVVANSWQQTPAGFELRQMLKDGQPWFIDGLPVLRAEILDFWQLVFNPSTVHRLVHVWIGCFIMGSFFIMSISAWYLLRGRHLEFARRSFRGALVLAAISSVAALVHGHFQADNVYRHQPAKVAAFEAHYETGRGDLVLFGLPDDATQSLKAKVAIPGGLSFLLHGDFETEVIGLDRFRPEDRPAVLVPFLSYRLMIGIGCAFIVLTVLACCLLPRDRLFRRRWLLWVFVLAIVPAVAANQAGWAVAEVGRQPWIVHPPAPYENGRLKLDADGFVDYPTVTVGLPDGGDHTTVQGLRTSDAVSRAVDSSQVLGSIAGFGLIYLLLAAVWLFILDRKIRHGPDPLPGDAGERPERGSGFLGAAADRLGHERDMAGSEGGAAPGGTA